MCSSCLGVYSLYTNITIAEAERAVACMLKGTRPLTTQSSNESLRDMLVKYIILLNPKCGKTEKSFHVYDLNDCNYRSCVLTSGKIKSTTLGRSFMTKKKVCCKSHNAIYCFSCSKLCTIVHTNTSEMRPKSEIWTRLDLQTTNKPASWPEHYQSMP